MEQARDIIRVGIHARQVRALVQVALVTSPGQVGQIIGAAVLTGLDVFGVKGMIRIVALGQMAILAAITRPLPHLRPGLSVHHAASCGRKSRRALA